ncbi:MAG: DUF3500 domain-containing protein [Lapillicoccus sp.]
MNTATTALREAAVAFVAALDPAGRQAALSPFDTDDRREWTYLPGPRPGVAVEDLDDSARTALDALLDATLSAAGALRTRAVMELDDVLRDLERGRGKGGWERRSSGRYWVRVLGSPTEALWAWHLGGHHVAIHATVVGDSLALTPCFLGANPAVVPSGPHAGMQVLREEEALARDLLGALDADQRRVAVVSRTAPSDIATRHDPLADRSLVPAGVARAQLDPDQQGRLEALVRCYVDRAPDSVAAERWRTLVAEGLDAVTFAWAGPTSPGEPHYYALRGESFLVEYDNTQDGANHAHTVWRDLRRDWGEDLLAQHHARDHR